MKIQPKLTHSQTQQQRIVMTPKLQQAIKVLMMPQLELKEYIEQELIQNPLLEIEEQPDISLTMEDYDPSLEWNNPEEDIAKEDTSVDIDWQTVFDDMRMPVSNGNIQYEDSNVPEPDIADVVSLQNYLLQQLQLSQFSETEHQIGELIIGNLNDDGKLQLKLFSLSTDFLVDLESGSVSDELRKTIGQNLSGPSSNSKKTNEETEDKQFDLIKIESSPESRIKKWHLVDSKDNKTYTIIHEGEELNLYELTLDDIATQVGCPVAKVEDVLHTIQDTFEPIGIAYRDLGESLSIQIRHFEVQHHKQNGNSPYDTDVPFQLAQLIVENHFQDLIDNRISTISEELDVDKTDIMKASSWIGTLSPYPGRYFSDPTVKVLTKSPEIVPGVTPDVKLVDIDGEYFILPNDNYIPRLRMNPYYVSLMQDEKKTLDVETKKWIQKKYNDAIDVLSSISQRGRTIERVTEAIFEVQSDFLKQGPQSLKPLTLKTVAEMAGVHESTVSRVTSNKFVETPIGTYPLKFFFRNQLATTQGSSVSPEHVKAAMKDLISNEDAAKPLSDQTVSSMLKKQGMVVARRTVQKYREELGILSSRQRKNG